MADVFISYSRKDQPMVRRLHDALVAQQREVWVDWEGIPPSAEWMREIQAAIDAADTFIFVISPDSVASVVCRQEVEHAVANNKRLVPILYREVDARQVPERAAAHNWIPFRESDDFEAAFGALAKAIDTDLDWVHAHTRLLVHALEWDSQRRDASFDLRGSELQAAERWLARAGEGKAPHPTPLQTQYILSSRKDANRRQRLAIEAVALGVLVAVVLGLLAWQRAQKANLYLARDFEADAIEALSDNDAERAEVLFAKSLTLDDRRETRERLLEARAKAARLLWVSPVQVGGRVLAIGPAGRRFVIRDAAYKLHLWDAEQRQELCVLPAAGAGPTAPVEPLCAAFSPDQSLLAVGGSDSIIHLWKLPAPRPGGAAQGAMQSAAQGALLRSLRGHRRDVLCVAFSPDGRTLASGGKDLAVYLWDVATGQPRRVLRGHAERIMSVAFSPDGRTLASGTWGNEVWLWEAASGRNLHRLSGHEDAVSSVAFSPDGRTLASASWDTKVWLWDVKSGLRLRPLNGFGRRILSVIFSRDGQLLVTGGEGGAVRFWEAATGRAILTLRGHTDHVHHVAFGLGGRRLLTGSDDGTLRLWDLESIGQRAELRTLHGHTRTVTSVVFSRDGRQLASGSEDGTVRLWDVRSGRTLRVLRGYPRGVASLAFSPDGRRLVTAGKDGVVRLWDTAKWQAGRMLRHPAAVWHVEFDPQGRMLATACDDAKIWLWDSAAGTLVRTFSGHSDAALCVGFSPDGRRLASGSEDKTIRLWDVASGKTLGTLRGHHGPVWDVIFIDHGRHLVSASEDGTIRRWDVASEKQLSLSRGHEGPAWDLSLVRDERWLASAGQDATARLWNLRDSVAPQAEESDALTLRACLGAVWWVDFSPDGRLLATGSQDRTIRLWNLQKVQDVLAQPPAQLFEEAQRESGLTVSEHDVVALAQPPVAPVEGD